MYRCESHPDAGLDHELPGGLAGVFDVAVEDGVADCILDVADGAARLETEGGHDVLAGDGRLPVAQAVLLLDLDHLVAHNLEVVVVALDLVGVLGGDVGLAEHHQVVDVVAGLEKQPADGGIGDVVLHERDGAQVQTDELLDVFEMLGDGQFQSVENAGGHLRAHHLVAMERPAVKRVEALGDGFGDVVEQRGPYQPDVTAAHRDVVHHLERMQIVVLMALAVDALYALERDDLGQEPL